MPLSLTEAVKLANRVRDDSFALRDRSRVFWTLAYCYAYGQQWGFARRRGAAITAQRLRQFTNPDHPSLRLHINHVGPAIRWLRANLAPKRMVANLIPADGTPNSRSVKFAGDALLKRHLGRIGAVDVYRHANEVRLVMGTGIIRRTIQMTGRRRTPGGRQLRDFRCRWSSVFPHDIIRDPTASTTHPGKHEFIYGYEKPMSLTQARMEYPNVEELKGENVDTTTLGALMDFQHHIQSAGMRGEHGHSQFSNEPGIVVYEFYYKDATKGPGWHWMVPMFSLHPPGANRGKLKPLLNPEQIQADKPLPNPFQPPPLDDRLAALGLPFHHINYEPELIAPWGSGVPWLLKPPQDLFNIGITWYGRAQQQGGGKIIVDGTTIEKPNRQFSNRLDQVVVWKPRVGGKSVQPFRLDPPPLTQGSTAFVDRSPDWIELALNRQRVQLGETSKRGESGQAVAAKLEAAGAPLDDIRVEDDRRLSELLWATFLDMANPRVLRPSQARRIIGDDIPPEHINALLREHPAKTTRGVKLQPGVLRPKSPEQEQEEFVNLSAQGILDALQVQRELSLRGVPINTQMRQNIEKQETELASMIGGAQADIAVDDDHRTHIFVIALLVGSTQWLALDEETQEAIEQHSALHRQTAMEVGQVDAAIEAAAITPPQPSPPGAAFGPQRQSAGAVTPVA